MEEREFFKTEKRYLQKLLSAFAWGFAAILILLMIVGLCSCNSSKKISSSERLKLDSVSLVKYDSTHIFKVDSLSQNIIIKTSDKTIIKSMPKRR